MKIKTIIFLILFFSSAAHAEIKISCSLFPIYDFTRAITQENAKVSLLLKPGTEPHEFEPSPMDIKNLNDSDIFIYTNRNFEHWAEKISNTLTNTLLLEASENIELINNDPHIWLDLTLAQKMIDNIVNSLCRIDKENSQTYINNAKIYSSKLEDLNKKFMALNHDKTLIFAGEFSYNYFVKKYNFDYISAYDGENEPGIRRLADIIKYINKNHEKYILSDFPITKLTHSISEQTNTEILTFSSMHNINDYSQTFIEIMTKNYENISRFIND